MHNWYFAAPLKIRKMAWWQGIRRSVRSYVQCGCNVVAKFWRLVGCSLYQELKLSAGTIAFRICMACYRRKSRENSFCPKRKGSFVFLRSEKSKWMFHFRCILHFLFAFDLQIPIFPREECIKLIWAMTTVARYEPGVRAFYHSATFLTIVQCTFYRCYNQLIHIDPPTHQYRKEVAASRQVLYMSGVISLAVCSNN